MIWMIAAVAVFDLAAVAVLVAGAGHPREPRQGAMFDAATSRGNRRNAERSRRSQPWPATSGGATSLRGSHKGVAPPPGPVPVPDPGNVDYP